MLARAWALYQRAAEDRDQARGARRQLVARAVEVVLDDVVEATRNVVNAMAAPAGMVGELGTDAWRARRGTIALRGLRPDDGDVKMLAEMIDGLDREVTRIENAIGAEWFTECRCKRAPIVKAVAA